MNVAPVILTAFAMLAIELVAHAQRFELDETSTPADAKRYLEGAIVKPGQVDEMAMIKRQSGIDYNRVLRGVLMKNRRSLALMFSSSRYVDGAPAEGYCSDIFAALIYWGDKSFAAELKSQPVKV